MKNKLKTCLVDKNKMKLKKNRMKSKVNKKMKWKKN